MFLFYFLYPLVYLLKDILFLKNPVDKLSSLTIFFPFFNDAGTVAKAIRNAYKYGRKVTQDLEVIAVHGGLSSDKTYEKILDQKKEHPDLIIVEKRDNKEGYAVIKYGFKKARKDWVFYTDGDLQYHLDDMEKLVQKQKETNADVVNGFRETRADSKLRVFFGNLYKYFSSYAFNLPISDLTCDFRLIRKRYLNRFTLTAKDSSILLELIKKLENSGAQFAEVRVSHYPRTYGVSAYSLFSLFRERLFGDMKVWLRLLADRNKSDSKRKVYPR